MPFHFGGLELALILVVILIVFGVGKLPQIGGAMGKALRGFRRAQSGDDIEEVKPKRAKRNKN